MKQGGTADKVYSSLMEIFYFRQGFFYALLFFILEGEQKNDQRSNRENREQGRLDL